MVCNGEPYITGARRRHKIAFDAGFFYDHLSRDGRFSIALFDGVTWPNGNFAPRPKRLHPYGFGLFDFSLATTDIRPIACGEPADREAVDKYVCFLPKIENSDCTMRSRQQKLQVISGKLSAARGVKIAQASGGRWRTLPPLSGSSVVRKFRGRALASFRSMSQISTGESASEEQIGGFFCTGGTADQSVAFATKNANRRNKLLRRIDCVIRYATL